MALAVVSAASCTSLDEHPRFAISSTTRHTDGKTTFSSASSFSELHSFPLNITKSSDFIISSLFNYMVWVNRLTTMSSLIQRHIWQALCAGVDWFTSQCRAADCTGYTVTASGNRSFLLILGSALSPAAISGVIRGQISDNYCHDLPPVIGFGGVVRVTSPMLLASFASSLPHSPHPKTNFALVPRISAGTNPINVKEQNQLTVKRCVVLMG